VLKVSPAAGAIGRSAWERIDGLSMFEWFTFSRVRPEQRRLLRLVHQCVAPVSTGGDRDSINTLYLGSSKGWKRIRYHGPSDNPDSLGAGKSYDEQNDFLFGEDVAIVRDAGSNVNYIVTAFLNHHDRQVSKPGYRIFDWDAGKQTLRLLDKWKPGSKAAEVYAFKAHGA
jgi:hypothetical protein